MTHKLNDGCFAFQEIIEHSSWAVTLLDAQFNVLYRSPAAEHINGWSRDELSETSLIDFIHPDDSIMVSALMQRVAGNPGSTESCVHRLRHSNGNYIWLKSSLTNMLEKANVQAIMYNFIDVSEQKMTELELTKQTEQITELLETMTDGFISLDENLCYTYINGQALKMARKPREEMIGRNIWDVFPDAVGSTTYEAIQTAFVDKKYVCNQDFYAPLQLWQENRVYPSGGGISLFIRDITKQKKEENHLKLLESVITNTTDSVMITEAEPFDLPGPLILYVNEAFTRMTGYAAAEVIGKTPRILQGPKTDKEELKRIGKCLRNWERCEATVINYKKNGEEFWINLALSPVADENGRFTHWISIERDVTNRKSEEKQKILLAETSQLFNEPMELNLLLEKLLERVVDYDHFVIGEIWLTSADKNKMSMVAKTTRPPQGEGFYEQTIEFASFAKGESMPGSVWESGKILEWDHLGDHPNFHCSEAARNTDVKTVYGIPIISENVTIGVLVLGSNEKRSEELKPLIPLFERLSVHFGVEIRRKQLEEELLQIFTLAPDIICTVGIDGYLKKVNPAMIYLFGYTEMELLAKPLDAFIHPGDLEYSKLEMEKFIAGVKILSFENRFVNRAGKTVWLSWTAHLNEREGLLFCVGKNIDSKKQTEQLLYASESNLNAVIENTDAYIYSFDRDLKFVTFNKEMSKMMESVYHTSVAPGYPVFDLLRAHHAEDLQEWREIYDRAFAGDSIQFEKEITVGSYHTYNSFSINPIWQNKEVTGLSCFVNDITDRKRTELSLLESEKRYSELFQLSPLPKLVFELETQRFLDVNEAAIKQYGYTREELLQMSIDQLSPRDNISLSKKMMFDLNQKDGTAIHSIIHQKKNGQTINVNIQSNPITFGGKNARIAAVNDVTKSLKHIHAIEAQNEKLKEISWLQSHVIRAPLARIMGLIALLNVTEDLPDETKKMLGYVLQSAKELDEVIHDIVVKTEVIDLKDI